MKPAREKAAAERGPFVGRSRELGELSRGLGEMLAGHGQLFLLEGEPGIGKTSLAENFTLEAAASAPRVLWAWCSDGPQAPALWPWLQLVHGYLQPNHSARARVQSQTRRGLQLDWATCQVSTLDELFRLPSDAAEIDFRVFNSIANFLKDAARRRPLILIFDTFEAADNASLRMLRFLACQLRDCRILVLAAYRIGAFRSAAFTGMSGELIGHGCWVPLRGLSEAQVGTLVEKVIGNPPDDRTVAAIHEASGGNPLMVNHLARLCLAERAGETNPQCGGALSWNGLRPVTQTHLAQLSTATRELLHVAAALGREFDFAAIKRATHRASEQIFEALAEAESLGLVNAIVREPEHRYRFTHGLVREALCEELPASMRVRLHRSAREKKIESAMPPDRHREVNGVSRSAGPNGAQKQIAEQNDAMDDAELTGLRCDANDRPFVSNGIDSVRETHGPVSNGINGGHALNGAHSRNSSSSELPTAVTGRNESPGNMFRREGEYWTLCFGNSLFRLRHSKGLALIGYLLHHPNQEFHVIDLGAVANNDSARLARRSLLAANSHLAETRAVPSDLGPLLDAPAKASYRRRLQELAEDLAEGRLLNDLGRIGRDEEEINQLNRELARAVGLNGRDRKAASEIERARIRVTNAIRASLDKIRDNQPAMRRYLSLTVKTGAICSYTPESGFSTWQF